jgi:hypothetical protein
MNERKKLPALLKPQPGSALDAAYETTKGSASSETSSEDNIKEIKKDIKKMSDDTKLILKEARASAKALKSIEKSIVTSKASMGGPEAGPAGDSFAIVQAINDQSKLISSMLKPAEKKAEEESGNASLTSGALAGGAGAAIASAGAVGLSYAGNALSRVGTGIKDFFGKAFSGNAQPGLSQVLDEEERKRKEAIEAGPPREIFEREQQRKQAEANQAADYSAAGNTMAAAGYSTVTGRSAWRAGAKEMEPADFEQAQQAQAAREAVQRGLRQRNRGGGISEPAVSVPETPAATPGAQPATSSVNALMIANEPFIPGKDLSENQLMAIESSKSMGNKYPPEVEAQYAKQKGTSSVSATAPAAATTTLASEQQGAQVTRADITSTFDAAALAEKDPETHAKFVARQQQLIRERRGELQGLGPRERTMKEERIKAQAFETAAKEFTPQAARVGAASVEGSISTSSELNAEGIRTLSVENKELGRESTQTSTQPVVIQNNNNMSSQTYTPVPAQPRVESSFSRHQERNAAY